MDTVLICTLVLVTTATMDASIVNTTVGEIQGSELPAFGIETFLGIPYAEAPEGGLRFKPPVRKARMEEVYSAVNNSFVCPQVQTALSAPGTIQTEDCLRLDVYKPLGASETNQLPVMIWIHGGGYAFGNSKTYNGGQISALFNVVFVAVNYRLGILGFLHTLDENSVGNFGLRDQCSAIEWVSENIARFGGNSSRVTIFGESAGSASVTQLAMSSLCRGKFQRVIAQSGTAWSPWSYNNDPLGLVRKLSTEAACPTETGPLVACLREKSFSELTSYQVVDVAGDGFGTWAPTYAGDVFPENPLEAFTRGESSEAVRRFRSLDLIIGVTTEEGEMSVLAQLTGGFGPVLNASIGILSDRDLEARFRRYLPLSGPVDALTIDKLLPSVRFQYTDWTNRADPFANARMAIRLSSDLTFVTDSVRVARGHAEAMTSAPAPGTTYFYQFARKPSWVPSYPWTVGATHAEDIFFLFGYTQLYNGTEEENALSQIMMEYWTNFAKTGNPNSPRQTFLQTTWPPFNTETEEYVILDVNMSRDSTASFPYARRVAFWEDFIPSQRKTIADFKREVEEAKCETVSSAIARNIHTLPIFAAVVFMYLVQ